MADKSTETLIEVLAGLPPKMRLALAENPLALALLGQKLLNAKEWKELFGSMIIMDREFNETNLPLEPELEFTPRVEEYSSTKRVNGYHAMKFIAESGYVLAGMRVAGRYLNERKNSRPSLRSNRFIAGGAIWRSSRYKNGYEWPDNYVPAFELRSSGEMTGSFHRLDYNNNEIEPDTSWLVYRKPA